MLSLPLILLGIRTALKQDISSTAAELVYGTTLCLPGEFFQLPPDPFDFGNKLKAHFPHITPISPRPAVSKSNIAKDLATATHVFIRHNAECKPLHPPYHGPYPVVKRSAKHFMIKLYDCTDTISIDRLKPAHLDSTNTPSETSQPQTPTTSPTPMPPPPTTTCSGRRVLVCSGRRVHFPTYLSHNV